MFNRMPVTQETARNVAPVAVNPAPQVQKVDAAYERSIWDSGVKFGRQEGKFSGFIRGLVIGFALGAGAVLSILHAQGQPTNHGTNLFTWNGTTSIGRISIINTNPPGWVYGFVKIPNAGISNVHIRRVLVSTNYGRSFVYTNGFLTSQDLEIEHLEKWVQIWGTLRTNVSKLSP